MSEIDSRIRDSEINLEKHMKYKDEKHRRKQLAKILAKKKQQEQHQNLQLADTTKQKKSKIYTAKDNLLELFDDYYLDKDHGIKDNLVKSYLIFKKSHGKVVLDADSKTELHNIKLTTKLGLATCNISNYKLYHNKYAHKHHMVGYLPYRLRYSSTLTKLLHKYAESKLYSHIQSFENFTDNEKVSNSLFTILLASFSIIPAYIIFGYFKNINVFHLGVALSSNNIILTVLVACLVSMLSTLFVSMGCLSFLDVLDDVCEKEKHKKELIFLKHSHEFVNDMLKLSKPSKKNEIKKLL